MTTTAALRTALKTAGYNARQVTVAADYSTLRVTIRSADVALSKVAAIANTFRQVRHCEATGEILCGGNTFVDVSYAKSIIAPAAAMIADRIRRGDGMTEIDGATVYADLADPMAPVHVRRAGEEIGTLGFYCYGVDHAAERLAAESLDRSASL